MDNKIIDQKVKAAFPLGFKYPRRVRIIAKRIGMTTMALKQFLQDRGEIVIGSTFLNNKQMRKIKELIEKAKRENKESPLNKEIKPFFKFKIRHKKDGVTKARSSKSFKPENHMTTKSSVWTVKLK